MAPLAVDPEAMFAAGTAVVAAGDGLVANLTVLTGGFTAHTGLDAAGMVFGLGYQDAAGSLLKAAAAAINACRHCGALIQQGASNYSQAEAASTLGGAGGALQAPVEPVKIAPPGPPGTWGAGEPPPPLWAIVQSFVDDVWPDGDVAGLHAAAGRWRGFGAALCGVQGTLNASKSLIGAQQIPEGEKVLHALWQIGDSANSIGTQCGKLAATLDNFANEVSQAQNSIRDLLHRLGSLADLGHDVVLILEGKALDEIEQIAEDINGVLHNLGREARGFEQSMKLGMQIIDQWVVDMEKHMRGELKHFLGDAVGNQVATVFDTWVNANEGAFKGLVGMVQGIEELDPRWFLIDPKGAAATWSGMAKSMWKGSLINSFLNPQEAGEANLQMLKSLLHLDDWSTARPGLGFGENAFDVATLFLPGVGEAGAGTKGAAAGARAAEEGGEAAGAAGRAGELGEVAGVSGELGDIGTASTGLTTDLEGVTGDLPKIEPPPVSGSPVGLAPGKPLETPVEATPHPPDAAPGAPQGPTAASAPPSPEPPGAAGGPHAREPAPNAAPHDPVPAPAGGPHEPVSAPAAGSPHTSVPVAAGERMPSSIPQLLEHSQARAPVSPSGPPSESVPVAAHSRQPAPALTSAAPHFTPPVGRPPEVPPAGNGGWHGPGDVGPEGGRPNGSAPHGGEPHKAGDSDPPGSRPPYSPPHDGKVTTPGDGSPREPREADRGAPAEDGSAQAHDGASGDAPPGHDFVGPYPLPARALVVPPPNGAFFWSGRTSDGLGIGPLSSGGSGAADSFAASHSGTTLEGLLDRNGVRPPKWSFDDTSAQEWWSQVSGIFAENVRGEVHAVIGSNLRPGSVWETVELPRLMDNPNVTKIVLIDPETGSERTVFER